MVSKRTLSRIGVDSIDDWYKKTIGVISLDNIKLAEDMVQKMSNPQLGDFMQYYYCTTDKTLFEKTQKIVILELKTR